MSDCRKYTNKFLELIDQGAFDLRILCRDLLGYMDDDNVEEFVLLNDYQIVSDSLEMDKEVEEHTIKVKFTLIQDGERCTVDLNEFINSLETSFPNCEVFVPSKGENFIYHTPEMVTLDSDQTFAQTTVAMIGDMTKYCFIEDQFGEAGSELFGLAEMAIECSEKFDDESAKRLWELFYEHTGHTIKVEVLDV